MKTISNIFRAARKYWNRLRYTGSFRRPGQLTAAELEQLQDLLNQRHQKP